MTSIERLPSIEVIKRAVADHYGVSIEKLESRDRSYPLVQHRQLAHYIALTRTKHSVNRIARCFCRDHVTMRWSKYQIERRLEGDERDRLIRHIDAIEQRIATTLEAKLAA